MKLNIQLFASGKIYYDKSSDSSWKWFQFNVDWESTPNYDTNQSTITTKAYVKAGTGGTQGTWKGTVKVGTFSHSISINKSVSSSWVLLATFTDTVDHNADGTLTLPIYGTLSGPTGTTLAGQTSGGTQNAVLDTIPRASSITVPDGTIGYGVPISINKASPSFKTKLYYKMNGQNEYTYISEVLNDSYTWIIPTNFYSLISNARSITGIVKADTYNGDTLIGSKESNLFTAYINETACKPEITGTSITDTLDLSSLTDRLIRYVSKPKITFTINAKNGSSITYKNPSTSPYTYSSWQDSYTVTAQDSRQLSNSYTFPMNPVNYIPLTISASAERQGETSDKVDLSISGNWFNGNFDKKTNTLELKVQYKLNGIDTWSEEILTPTISGNTFSINKTLNASFDYQQIYNIRIIAIDEVGKILGYKIENLKNISRGQPNWEAYHDDDGEHFEVNGNMTAENIVLKGYNGSNGTSGVWFKICNIKFKNHVQGEFVGMRIYIGEGNNCRGNQNAYIDLNGQLGWIGNGGLLGIVARLHPFETNFSLDNVKIKVISNTNINYDIWLWTTATYCVPNYVVNDKQKNVIVRGEPTVENEPSGTECNIEYDYNSRFNKLLGTSSGNIYTDNGQLITRKNGKYITISNENGTFGHIITDADNGMWTNKNFYAEYDLYSRWQRVLREGELCFSSGEQFIKPYYSSNILHCAGMVSGGSQSLLITIPLPKSMRNISTITVNSLKANVRGIKGYINASTYVEGGNEYVTGGITITPYKSTDNMLSLTITKSSAFSNTTNNTPITFSIDSMTITFS